VMEVFGSAPQGVGMGLHRFRDPRLTEDWSVVDLPIDVAEFHVYAVEWSPDELVFSVDQSVVKRVDQAPDYPVQLEIAVFDFPDKGGPLVVPELFVSEVVVS
jgi:hypothetical protein